MFVCLSKLFIYSSEGVSKQLVLQFGWEMLLIPQKLSRVKMLNFWKRDTAPESIFSTSKT